MIVDRERRRVAEQTAHLLREPSRSTRLAPPRLVDDGLVRRPRLLDALHKHLARRATAVVAPAGYGKTTLLAQFASEVDALVCWCTLDEHDQDARVLLADLVAAIARRVCGFGERTLAAVAEVADTGEGQQLRTAVRLLVAELERVPDFLVLVVDDCHRLIGSSHAGTVLDLLVQHLPDHCHLILAGRSLPDLPALPGLVARRQAARLEQGQLRLTVPEVEGVVRSAGLDGVTPAQIEALHARTAGWPMAVQLLVSHAVEQGEPLAALHAGGDGQWSARPIPYRARQTLFAYLASDVLALQPRPLQETVLYASVLPYVEVDRCATLLGRPAGEVGRLLATAEARGLFVARIEDGPETQPSTAPALAGPPIPSVAVPRAAPGSDALGSAPFSAAPGRQDGLATLTDAEVGRLPASGPAGATGDRITRAGQLPVCYRFHDLFREFLLETLREQQPVRYRWLQRRAARLAEAAGDLPGAIAHALAGARWSQAARLIEAAAPQCTATGRWYTLRMWLRALPARILEQRPRLLLLAARAEYALEGDSEHASLLLSSVERKVSAGADEVAELHLVRVGLLRLKGQYRRAARLAQNVLRELAKGPPTKIRADAHFQLAMCAHRLGQLLKARSHFDAAARIYAEAKDQAREALARDGLAAVEICLGRLERARSELHAAERTWRLAGNAGALARTLNNLGLTYHYTYDLETARCLFDDAVRFAAEADLPGIEACAWLSLGDVQRDCDNLQAAASAYQRGLSLASTAGSAYLMRYATDAMGQLRRLSGDLDGAEVMARQAVHQAHETGSRYEEGLYLLSLALVHLERREYNLAWQALDRSLAALQASGAKREAARARLYRAQVMFAARRRTDAARELAALGELLVELGYYGFLVGDARRAMAVLDYAVARDIGGARVAALREAALRSAEQAPPSGPLHAAALGSTQGRPIPGTEKDDLWRRQMSQGPATAFRLDEPAAEAGTCQTGSVSAQAAPTNGLPRIEARSLGHSHVRCAGRPVMDGQWRSPKSKELFFYLLCNPGWQRREKIAADVWGDVTPAQARSGFHTNAHRLRRALFHDVLQQSGGRYRLNPEVRYWFDAEEFARHCREACERPGSPEMARAAQQALALYGGPFLDDLSPEWAEPLRERLEALYLEIVVQFGRYHAARGDYDEAIRLAEQALAVNPYLEPAGELLATAQAAKGQSIAARHRCQRYAERLRRDLHPEPAP